MKTFIRSSPWMRLPRTTLCKINIPITDRFSELLGFFPSSPWELLPPGTISASSAAPWSHRLCISHQAHPSFQPPPTPAACGLCRSSGVSSVSAGSSAGVGVGGGGISHQTPRHTQVRPSFLTRHSTVFPLEQRTELAHTRVSSAAPEGQPRAQQLLWPHIPTQRHF